MPQAPLPVYDTAAVGKSAALNQTTTGVIKTSGGKLRRLVIEAVGSSGVWTLNDCLTVAAASAANQLFTIAYNAADHGTTLVAGSVIEINVPFSLGLVLSAVPGGSPQANVTYD